MRHEHPLTEAELYDLHIFHRLDHEANRRKLSALYGHVARRQNELIARHVIGHTVLDAGAGYGLLTRQLLDQGFRVTAIDLHAESRAMAKKWYGVDVMEGDIYATPFPEKSFDTVVLREVSEHLEFRDALVEVARLARCAVIVLEANVTRLVKAARALAGLHEFNAQPAGYYVGELQRIGLVTDTIIYRDVLAFPLSGNFVAPQRIPDLRRLYPAVLAVDSLISGLARWTRLETHLSWRVLIRARVPSAL